MANINLPVNLSIVVNTSDLMQALDVHNEWLYSQVGDACLRIRLFDAQDREVGHLSGFHYCREPYILTAGHVKGWHDAVKYVAVHSDGTEEVVTVCAHSTVPDIAVLKGHLPVKSFLRASIFKQAQTGYVFGYASDSTALRVSSGIVSSAPQSFMCTIASHSDHGYSGGPCTDAHGKWFGMVVGGEGQAMMLTRFIPAMVVNAILAQFGLEVQ